MVFSHDVELALQAATTIANSALEPDTLTSVAELSEIYDDFSYAGRHDADRDELEAVRALREELRTLLLATPEEAVGLVNRMLAEEHALPQLTRHDQFDWHLHAVSGEEPLAKRVRVETAMAMVDVIRADELDRLRVCAADDCEDVVVDLSKNRSKRFCNGGCGNRANVAAYRQRRKVEL